MNAFRSSSVGSNLDVASTIKSICHIRYFHESISAPTAGRSSDSSGPYGSQLKELYHFIHYYVRYHTPSP
jgi:hypothetical protein